MATHYCGGLAVKTKLVLGNAMIDCGMKMEKECESKESKDLTLTKSPCCQNEYQSLDVEDDFKPNFVQTLNVDFVAAFVVAFFYLPLTSTEEKPQYANYSPPLIDQDRSVLHQVFLI